MMISILMTGRLVPNSLNALVLPIANSNLVKEIQFVSDVPGPQMPRLIYKCPPLWMQKIFGRYFAKLLLLFYLGLKERPDLIYAFNIFPHGLSAFLLSKFLGTKSCISVIGGKEAILDGGVQGDNWVLRLGGVKKPWLEKLFLFVLKSTDIVTAMGEDNQKMLKNRLVPYAVILPLFIDTERFHPSNGNRNIDIISASSLIPRKRIDLLLKAISETRIDQVKVRILGTGHLAEELKRMAKSFGIENHVKFVGFSEDFEHSLQRSKLFFMASNTEGLSIAMLMAMACGAVPLVRDVGDLTQAAHDGKNAIVLQSDCPSEFAQAIDSVLGDDEKWQSLSYEAINFIHLHYSLTQSSQEWDEILDYHFG